MPPIKRLFLSPPHIGGEEFDLVREAFASNYIAPLGPMVDAFEREFAEYTGIPALPGARQWYGGHASGVARARCWPR